MAHHVFVPPPVPHGGRVAVISPSWASPEWYPVVHEQALRRLREVVGVEPVEYASTRRSASPAERAEDLMAAFADRRRRDPRDDRWGRPDHRAPSS